MSSLAHERLSAGALLKILSGCHKQVEHGLTRRSSRGQRTFRPFYDCRRGAAGSQLQAIRQKQLLADAGSGRRPATLRCCCSNESSSSGSSGAAGEQYAGGLLRGRGAALRQTAAAAAICAALLAGAPQCLHCAEYRVVPAPAPGVTAGCPSVGGLLTQRHQRHCSQACLCVLWLSLRLLFPANRTIW